MTGITVMDPVTIEDSGPALAPQERVVLAVLVSRRVREVGADTLVEASAGSIRRPARRRWCRVASARLSRRLGPEAIATRPRSAVAPSPRCYGRPSR